MEDDKAVKVWVVRLEVSGLVEGVVVIDIGADLHGVGDAVFDDGAEGIEWGLFWHRQFLLAVRHALGANEVEGELYAVEEVGELHPCFAWEGGFSAGTEDEEADGGRGQFCVLPGVAATGSWWVEGVSKCCGVISMLFKQPKSHYPPLKLFRPSGVMRPSFLKL